VLVLVDVLLVYFLPKKAGLAQLPDVQKVERSKGRRGRS